MAGGKKARNKGVYAEQEVARMLRPWFPEARRSFGQARRGEEQPDIIGVPDFYIEVKRYAKPESRRQKHRWYERCVEGAVLHREITGGEYRIPVLIYRYDGEVWMVGMAWTWWREMGDGCRHYKHPVCAARPFVDFAALLDANYGKKGDAA